MRRLLVLVSLIGALLAGGSALGHNDSCLIAIHAGGIQQHLVCS